MLPVNVLDQVICPLLTLCGFRLFCRVSCVMCLHAIGLWGETRGGVGLRFRIEDRRDSWLFPAYGFRHDFVVVWGVGFLVFLGCFGWCWWGGRGVGVLFGGLFRVLVTDVFFVFHLR